MKQSEIIRAHYAELIEAMTDYYRAVLDSAGRVQYKIYIWSDGEIHALEGVQGDNAYLVPREHETRELYHVCTIAEPCFDPWDYADSAAPDDEQERTETERQIIDYLVDNYRTDGASAILDSVIDQAEQEEFYRS